MANDSAKAVEKAEQHDEPARPRIASSVNLDVVANSAGAAWAFVGVVTHMPIEYILAGTAATSAMNMWQVVTAKIEDVRERRKGKGR
ncbi:hypothetical protein [Kineosporia mesophila]|nr:hypothetical protein [Kineosporia mesophila]MCD5353224.1 hypothetical protein [Kineosporia mesophila]